MKYMPQPLAVLRLTHMLVMAESEAMTKNRIAPRLATGLYLTRVTSISVAVTLDASSFSAISTALALADSRVEMSS
jgi:hypothetical protein